mmetsp:Transcript_20654/g.26721  ORF Transcript_20654/g.26721 Transcript_20654/m.26721 type:complete len:106 (+) Transcript_20654:2149-2466(+)
MKMTQAKDIFRNDYDQSKKIRSALSKDNSTKKQYTNFCDGTVDYRDKKSDILVSTCTKSQIHRIPYTCFANIYSYNHGPKSKCELKRDFNTKMTYGNLKFLLRYN